MDPKIALSPPLLLSGPTTQSILASSHMRVPKEHPMDKSTSEIIIDGGNGVKLMALHSPQPGGTDKGLAILLHGWEGSHNSVYMIRTSRALFDRGFDVLRLNLRDHGPTHHLNQGLFLGTLIEESHQGVINAAKLAGGGPVFLVGWSMGGNFALRMGIRHAKEPIPGIQRIVAISPGINPEESTVTLDDILWSRYYFMKKWKRSLRAKQEAWPDLYDFSDVLECVTVMGMTAKMLRTYTDFKSCDDYFSRYNITGDFLYDIAVPTTILTAEDDPVITVKDFYELKLNEITDLFITPHGGHCGFIEGWNFTSYYEHWLPDLFEREL